MSQVIINDNEVDIVIGALHSELTTFMNEWKPIFSRFHLIIVKDTDLKEELQIPEGFSADVYTKSEIEQVVGSSTSIRFSGYACRYFSFLVSKKKYVVCIDDDCVPEKDNAGNFVDAVAPHIVNLKTPATPFFFNTLYDPFCRGADFVPGYLFSLRNEVDCALSCELWLNLADLDAPIQALKPAQRKSRYVDAVLTVPVRAMLPVSGINIAFNRELVGPTLVPALVLAGEGKIRWETVEDIWCGLCVKVICDHLGLGVKSGLPYVSRTERGNVIDKLKKEWEGVKMIEEVVPFFRSVRLPQSATTAEDCVVEMAKSVKEQLGRCITSVVLMRDANGRSKCFGFVNFKNPDNAANVVEALNGCLHSDSENNGYLDSGNSGRTDCGVLGKWTVGSDFWWRKLSSLCRGSCCSPYEWALS
ncbi:probable UDP-arabinopyranose mutase 5 [Cicer arietinum]|uniref:Probable UDP-arabinopyranose mutase 5 n=1 Tax=Cicer arietinum TaxID=3827 RepID=A0A1S2Z749_CICAR|nr:probable UDP-arabinopyranose mutase 5 [Cicer arietinum]